jgi:hypothetical protein
VEPPVGAKPGAVGALVVGIFVVVVPVVVVVVVVAVVVVVPGIDEVEACWALRSLVIMEASSVRVSTASGERPSGRWVAIARGCL